MSFTLQPDVRELGAVIEAGIEPLAVIARLTASQLLYEITIRTLDQVMVDIPIITFHLERYLVWSEYGTRHYGLIVFAPRITSVQLPAGITAKAEQAKVAEFERSEAALRDEEKRSQTGRKHRKQATGHSGYNPESDTSRQEEDKRRAEKRSKLHHNLAQYFNETEIRELCFFLVVDYDDLPGEGKAGKVRELIMLLERLERTVQLIEQCRKLRPNLEWDEL